MRGLRSRLVLAVAAVVVLAFGGLILGFNLLLADQLNSDANGVLRSRAAAEVASLTVGNGRIVVPEAPDSAELDSVTWVFDGLRPLEQPRTRPEVSDAATRLVAEGRRTTEIAKDDIRLRATPIVAGGRQIGTVVSGVSLAPYEKTKHDALVGSLIMGALLLLVVLLVARWMVTIALRPVAEMTSQVADWSEHDLDRRFALGPPHDELTTLAATLDGLLARIGASMRHEQRFSSEMSHELRTPLTKIKAEAELALRSDTGHREALERVLRGADQIGRIVDSLLAAAREEAAAQRGVTDAYEAAMAAVDACDRIAREGHVRLAVDASPVPVRAAADRDLVERILIPLVENACRYGVNSARVSIAADESVVRFDVIDDGPGVSDSESERVFEPGVRGSAAAGDGHGAGLGLSLARRLARTAGGEVEVQSGVPGGRFTVTLPSV